MGYGGGVYDVVLVLHVACGLVGFGALMLTGAYAMTAGRRAGPGEGATRYFGPGTNWPGRALYGVPVLGLAMVEMSGGRYGFQQTWLWLGLTLWLLAALTAEVVLWPAERRIQALVSARAGAAPGSPAAGAEAGSSGAGPVAGSDELRRACRRASTSAAGLAVVFAVALGIMLGKPGGPG